MKKSIVAFLVVLSFFASVQVQAARTKITDWYIQDFVSEITVKKDSSLDIVETITADCGNLPEKHGIFRILPTQLNIDGKTVRTPVKLLSITDEKGKAYNYSTTTDSATVSWKIGDANKTVQGVNIYKIHYQIRNAIRFANSDFDEFYWNLNGNFWDLQTDHFLAKIHFPSEVDQNNSTVDYYTGPLGSKSKDLASFRWSEANTLEFESTKMLDVRQGITASVIFPKNIFTPYQPTFWERYGAYFSLLIPVLTFLFCYQIWKKYGDDPNVDKTIIPEYDVPGKLTPIEIGMLQKSGKFDNKLITAEIVYLATRRAINIKEIHKKILFFDSKDYELIDTHNPEAEKQLNHAQQSLKYSIFFGTQSKKLSEMKNSFYKHIPDIQAAGKKLLKEKKLVEFTGLNWSIALRILSIFIFIFLFIFGLFSVVLFLSLLVTAIITLVFSFIMPKRTLAGAELNWQLKGFKLFMETVDKDRAKFYEKENIFEKFLPYAIVFGITGEWIKRMKEIYGEEYFQHYAPVWYVGNLGSFNADSLTSTMDSLADSIATSAASPSSSGSGAGGGGGSGGGGGGGGGGGW